MATITSYLKRIKTAIYGEEVRDSIVSAIETVNEDNEAYKTMANDAATAVARANEIIAGKVGIDDTTVGLGTTYSSSYLKSALTDGNGWVEPTLSDSFVNYGGLTANTPKYKKIGNIVSVKGAVSPSAADNILGSTTTTTICTLPAGYRPTDANVDVICHGSGTAIWLLTITTGGILRASRHRDTSGYTTPSTTAWMPFYITFIV